MRFLGVRCLGATKNRTVSRGYEESTLNPLRCCNTSRKYMGMKNAATSQPAEVMIVRTTADGSRVEFWTDGAIGFQVDRFHSKIFARSVPRDLARIVAEDVAMFAAPEIRALVKAARRAWDMHKREPHRVRLCDVRAVMLAHAPVGGD